MKERFARAPFIRHEKDTTEGLVGFDKSLSEEDVAFVKEKVKKIGDKEVTWLAVEGIVHV